MANEEHLNILRLGSIVWNKWREKHPETQPDLNSADLSNRNLSNIDLSNTDLSEVIFWGTNLSGAKLNGSSLFGTTFNGANLDNADLSHTYIGWVTFGDIDLRLTKGLDTVHHGEPSTIGMDTIIQSHGKISEVFLRGAGVPESIIEQIPALVGSLKPIDFYSCFFSHSSKDNAFVTRLYADLISNNVRCWFAPKDLKWGERIRPGIDEAIRKHDKLLLILSKHSVARGWVEREVKTALAREKKEKRIVLFPVRVDRAVFDCPFEWATEICHERNIGDFTRWKDNDEYQIAFERLLRDLHT